MSVAGLQIDISKGGVTRVLIVSVVVLHLLNIPAVAFMYAWPWDWTRHYVAFFSVSAEGKLPTFYSGVTLLAAASLLGWIALHERLRDGRFHRHWTGLGVIFALMAMDEMVAIHELSTNPIRSYFGISAGPLYHAWVIPAMAFLAVMATVYRPFVMALPARSRVFFLAAGGTYVSGALGMEMAGSAYIATYGPDLYYGLLSTVEEVLEMSGIVVFIYGLLDYLERHAPGSRIHVVG